MQFVRYVLKSNAKTPLNISHLPGAPFVLHSVEEIQIRITPNSDFWKLGIRFSKTYPIRFGKTIKLQKDEYIDYVISVGAYEDNKWDYGDLLKLHRQETISRIESALGQMRYVPRTEILLRLMNFDEGNTFELTIEQNDESIINTPIKLPPSYGYFQLFAYANHISYDLELSVIQFPKIQRQLEGLQVTRIQLGRIQLQVGDMFNSDILRQADLVLLPASTEGTATSANLLRASELGIPYPVDSPEELVSVFPVAYTAGMFAGYAYSVTGGGSDMNIIQKICNEIISIPERYHAIRSIVIPLFGTGAGGLDPFQVLDMYDNVFNNPDKIKDNLSIIVCIIDKQILDESIRAFGTRMQYFDDDILYDRSASIHNLEKVLNGFVSIGYYKLSSRDEITELTLENGVVNLLVIRKLVPKLTRLSLVNVKVMRFEVVGSYRSLLKLQLINCTGIEVKMVSRLTHLKSLSLDFMKISSLEFLKGLKGLTELSLKGNSIRSIAVLKSLPTIHHLNVSNNLITSLQMLGRFPNLTVLNLSNNKITNLRSLENLQRLISLDISGNAIADFSPLENLVSIRFLKADKNPFVSKSGVVLNERENHLIAVRSYLMRQAEKGKKEIKLPVKIQLLGNHASGKSSLLAYVQSSKLSKNTASTHIIKIEYYKLDRKTNIPKAIFFDFGGQDYYHGIYRAFLSHGGIYILVWNQKYDTNMVRSDSNDIPTQDFTLQYWLGQKSYLESEKYRANADPLLLVQSHADETDKKFIHNRKEYSEHVTHDFFLAFREKGKPAAFNAINNAALAHFKLYLENLIDRTRKLSFEPNWYIKFIQFVIAKSISSDHKPVDVKTLTSHYKRPGYNTNEYLMNDLDQLHQRGLILYYKNELPNYVWFNPGALAEYVHNQILDKSIITTYKGRVPTDRFKKFDLAIMQLLMLQKVIFNHEYGDDGKPEVIVPNFLPISSEDNSDMPFMTFEFGTPSFVMKFVDFLPFGMINQIISFYGNQKAHKLFFRDRILFLFEGLAKVDIRIDFQMLEIFVNISFRREVNEAERENVRRYIYYTLMAFYWDLDLLDFELFKSVQFDDGISAGINEHHPKFRAKEQCDGLFQKMECRPTDLFVSIDNIYFVKYCDLFENVGVPLVTAYKIGADRRIHDEKRTVEIYPFQLFVKKDLKRKKKVAISYSKDDLTLVDKFRQHLTALERQGYIEDPWYCTMLEAGKEWNEEIFKKFDEADIIFFMVSENLMANKYVQEFEIKKAIEKWDSKNSSIRIIPILLKANDWNRPEPYNLQRFSGAPYALRPITSFDSEDQNTVWYSIVLWVKSMIENSRYPGRDTPTLNRELQSIYEMIKEGKI